MSGDFTDQLVLASASERRKQLLEQIGLRCLVQVSNVDETPFVGEAADAYARRMALAKAKAEYARDDLPILGADTVVVIDDLIIGKPTDQADAFAILQRLQGRQHAVITAVALYWKGEIFQSVSQSLVWFRSLTQKECDAYWRSGEPQGKAGAYAIQGLGAVFIEKIEGSYSGVMGLPLYETAKLLEHAGIYPLQNRI